METLTQIKDRVAQKHLFKDWKALLIHIRSYNYPISEFELIENEAMQEYANTRCIRQRELCAESADTFLKTHETPSFARNSVLTAPLATEE